MINTYCLTTERIYICKSTFVLIIDALEWKQQRRGSLWSTNNCPRLHSAHSTYILSENVSLVPLICMNTCHYNPRPSRKKPNIIINKKTGDLIGPWGKMWNKKIKKKTAKVGKIFFFEKTNKKHKNKSVGEAEKKIKLRKKRLWLQTRKHDVQQFH